MHGLVRGEVKTETIRFDGWEMCFVRHWCYMRYLSVHQVELFAREVIGVEHWVGHGTFLWDLRQGYCLEGWCFLWFARGQS